MPFESRQQAKFMFAHQADKTKLGAVAREFVSASHGMKLKDLPKRAKPATKKPERKFGTLAGE